MRDLLLARVIQYLKDNGAAEICKTHAERLTDFILLGLPAPVTGSVSKNTVNFSLRGVAGEVRFTKLPEDVEAIEAYFFIPGQTEPV